MISLVACGHTIGSVHSVDHPEIVITGNASAENIAQFDSTASNFDNKVVTEYLDNSGHNPLIRNTNDTLNSDKRIFGSDGNVTMKRLAEPAFFKSQCESLLGRMIDLVPGDVNLTDPLQPADVRPYIQSYLVKGNGTVELVGRVRVRTSEVTGRDPADLAVTLLPTDRDGASGSEIFTTMARFQGGSTFGYMGETFQWFEFSTSLAASSAISSFDIRVTTPSNNQSVVHDNDGTGGYPLNADVLLLRPQSCVYFDSNTDTGNVTLSVAVSKALLGTSTATPQVRIVQKTRQERNYIPKLTEEVVPLEKIGRETPEYVYYQAKTVVTSAGLQTSFDVEVGESSLTFQETAEMVGRDCAAF